MAGQPKKEIDFETAKRLCYIQCTGEEVAAVLGVDYETLATRIREEYEQDFPTFRNEHSAGGKASLRRMQWKAAEGGNVTMQIWLGKQNLGQTDKAEIEADMNLSIKIDYGTDDTSE